MSAAVLASELTHRTLWYPTILGVLVIVAAVVLFLGSIYLLLGTNLGARLGFLVAFAAFSGFMVVLSALWCTTASPLNTLKGRIPGWEVQQVVPKPDKAKIADVRGIETKVNRIDDPSEVANVKAAVDEALVTKVDIPTAPVEEGANDFASFEDVTRYQVLEVYEVGGSNPQFWKGEFGHQTQYAAAQFCEVLPQPEDRTFGLPPLPPECDPDGKSGWVILTRDLGSLRLPPFVAFVISSILFALSLLMLHWREKDEMEAEAEAAAAPPRPAPVPAKV
jgi:hypothetical protein